MHLLSWAAGTAALALLAANSAAATTPVETLNLGMSAFVENAAGTAIFATVPDHNEVAVINAATLQVTQTISTGFTPVALSLSLDGSKVYVANHGSTSIGVINTATLTAGSPIPLGAGVNPLAVVPGTNNRLWALVGAQNQFSSIIQIDATTGASTGANANGYLIYGGDLRASADGKAFYYGDFGTSGSYLAKFDTSGANATQVWSIDPGGNGEDLELSPDGKSVVLICGGGNTNFGYYDAIYRTQDGSTAGTFEVGAYPRAFAFSPDSIVGYAGEHFHSPNIQDFDLSTFNPAGQIVASSDPSALFVDVSGRYLFADLGSTTAIYATGRVSTLPEPNCLALFGLALFGMLRRSRGLPAST
jgi:YVTN family beta-propeller protein